MRFAAVEKTNLKLFKTEFFPVSNFVTLASTNLKPNSFEETWLQLELQMETERGRMPESAATKATKARSKRHAVALEQPVASCTATFKKSAEMRGVCGIDLRRP